MFSPMAYGWIVIFLLGSMFHFLYDWSGENFMIGLVAPVNESIWEHLKMALFPNIIYWSIYYFIYRDSLDKNHWFTGLLVAMITAMILIVTLYYAYTQALGVELVVVDILIFLVAILGGQHMAKHVYVHFKQMPFIYAIIGVVLVVILFVYWTLSPPKLPIFLDGETETYGIYQLK